MFGYGPRAEGEGNQQTAKKNGLVSAGKTVRASGYGQCERLPPASAKR